jgi:hypothetical protein
MAALGSDVYCCASNNIYKQTNGTGNFVSLGVTSRNYSQITAFGSDLYAAVYNGDIYKQTGGTGDFVAYNQGNRGWGGLATLNTSIYACVYGGDIYKAVSS